MTKEEFDNLKFGDIIKQNSCYYIVVNQIDDTFISTQELSDIGKKTEFGYIHVNVNYNYAEVVNDKNVINAIHKWNILNEDNSIEPYSFIIGYTEALK